MRHTFKNKLILERWLLENVENPYPTPKTKRELAKQTNLSIKQIDIWFKNSRKKIRKNKISTRFSIEQKKILRDYFKKCRFPSNNEIKELSQLLNQSDKRISSWFAKERFNLKKRANDILTNILNV